MEVKAKGSMVVASCPAITPAEICVMCDSRELLAQGRRMVAAGEGGGTHGGEADATDSFQCGKCWAEVEAATSIQTWHHGKRGWAIFMARFEMCVMCDCRKLLVQGRMVGAGEGGGNYGGATGGFECGKCWAEAEAATNIQSMYRARQNQKEFLEGTRKCQYCANLGRLCEGRIVDELLEDHHDIELHDFTVGDGSLKERATAFAKVIFADRDQTGRGK